VAGLLVRQLSMTRITKLTLCILIAVTAHAAIFAVTDACLRAANAALRSSGPADVGAVEWSHRYYYDYASEALAGRVPYRDFPFEYPILSYPLFLIPRLLVSEFEGYRVAFMAEMLLFDVAAIVLIARHGGDVEPVGVVAGRLVWYTLYCFLLAPLVIGRFELAPMVLAFAAASWWFSGRAVLGGVTAGLGTLMKVFPGLVAAPAMVKEVVSLRTARPRGAAPFLATLGLGLASWLWLGGSRVIGSLAYHAERGLEIESLFGGLVLLAGAITGQAVPWVFDHNAYHVAPGWGAGLARLSFPLQAATLFLVVWRFWESGMADGIRYPSAAVLAFVIPGKVLSPQYLIWLFPFLAVLDRGTGSLARRVFLLCCLTTTLIYPGPGFVMILGHEAWAILLLNMRNALMIWLLALLLSRPAAEVSPAHLSSITDNPSGGLR
jgi:hypothetical protein